MAETYYVGESLKVSYEGYDGTLLACLQEMATKIKELSDLVVKLEEDIKTLTPSQKTTP